MLRFLYVIIVNLFRAPYIIPKMRKQAGHPEQYSEEQRYKLAKHVVRLLKASGKVHTEVYGTDLLPESGGYIMYPNHQGKYDALGIVYSHTNPCSLVMDKAKSNSFLVKEFVDLVQGKRLEKDNVRQALTIINEVAKEAAEGRKYILFPEGGYEFNNKNRVEAFKAGSFKSAVKAKVPIVPVAIIDSYKVFNSFYMGKVTTQVHYLKPLYYEDYKDLKTSEIAALVHERILQTIAAFAN
ncbi:MAG: 1-acyl-sn-glycerol-3-phosphate acyltransferase [Lachnospiraceae bacterium]|nr:1-acyl-sn-glycerol-3-phosphate acyltransferase [Lachnospiraceae bacterium]